MALFRSALAAAALVGTALMTPLAAHAASPIAVVDLGRVYKESAAGRYAEAQLKAISDNVRAELQPEANGLTNDQKTLGPKFQGKSPQQINAELQADKDLQNKYAAYQQRLQNFLGKQELRDQEMQATARKALSDVLAQAQPSIEEARRAKNADVVLEVNATVAHDPGLDITNDVLARFNKRVTSVPVTKIDLTKQQP